MKFNNQLMHQDILKRLNEIKVPQTKLNKTKIGITRGALSRLGNDGNIRFKTFLKLLKWLDYDANRYINNK